MGSADPPFHLGLSAVYKWAWARRVEAQPPGILAYTPKHPDVPGAIRCLGYYPKNVQWTKKVKTPDDLLGPVDVSFKIYITRHYQHIGTYGFAKSNLQSELNALARIDVPPLAGPVNAEAWAYAVYAVKQELSPHFGRYGVTPLRECGFASSASGPIGKVVGIKDRVKFLSMFTHDEAQFWKFAEENCHFGSSTKEEPLPLDKIIQMLLRLFNPVDPVLEALCKMCFAKMDEGIFKSGGTTFFATGFVKQYGGYHELMDWLMRIGDERVIREGDVSKYDSHFWVWIRMVCMEIRLLCLSDGVPFYVRVKIIWIYGMLTNNATIVTMCGQILSAPFWMKSGDYLTAKDNSIGHMLIIFYVIYRCGMRYNPAEMRLKVMADDHIHSLLPHVAQKWTLKRSVKYYKELGHDLKAPPESWDSGTVEGHSFLGGTAIWRRGKWIGKPNAEKLIASFIHRPKRQGLIHRYTRLRSLAIESFPDANLYRVFHKLLVEYKQYLQFALDKPVVTLADLGVHDLSDVLPVLPTEVDLWKFYLGEESTTRPFSRS